MLTLGTFLGNRFDPSMIIRAAQPVRVHDLEGFAWSSLRRFQNVEMVTDRLVDMHRIPAKRRDNAKKQATQIRYCLIQAREYFLAASGVSLATKPNLLYYGIMSLALAEILFKQTGESSLDRARAENKHHGLSMSVGGFPKRPTLQQAAEQLRASPVSIAGQHRGTFALWHRSSREHPLVGKRTEYSPLGGSTFSYDVLYGVTEKPYPNIPDGGLTLAEMLAGIPLMLEQMKTLAMPTKMVRGSISTDLRGTEAEWRSVLKLIFHPNPHNASLLDGIMMKPESVNFVDLHQVEQAYQFTMNFDHLHNDLDIPLPHAAMVSVNEFRMWCQKPCLNEFGHIYVAMYLAGNYARYFPDQWLNDVESATPLALAIEHLCDMSEWRAPWLALCELEGTLFVREM